MNSNDTKAEYSAPSDSSELLEQLYDELRQLAAAKLAGDGALTLQPTALVHEAYIRLVSCEDEDDAEPKWNSEGHFFGAAAKAMRRILVDHARKKQTQKRGQNPDFTEIREDLISAEGAESDEILRVHEALGILETENPEAAELVQLRFFAGMTIPETAAILDTSEASVKRLWTYARAKLMTIISAAEEN